MSTFCQLHSLVIAVGLQGEAVHTPAPARLSSSSLRMSPGHDSRTGALTQGVTIELDRRAKASLGPELRN